MKLLINILSVVLFFSFISCELTDPNPVNELTGVKQIKLIADDEDVERLFNNRFTDLEVPVKVNFDGEIHSGKLRASGAGSRYFPKFSFRVILDNSRILGVPEFSLSAQPSDPTFVKTAIATFLYEQAGFPVFFSEPVFVTLNNRNYGLYNFIERINEDFFLRRNLSIRELYKVQFDARFTFFKENSLSHNFDKEVPNDDNYSSLADLIIASDNTPSDEVPEVLGKYMDIDNYLWYHAISTIRSDPDSYTNNFYLYKSTYESPFKFFPWDFDKTFTGKIGLYGYNELIESLLRNELILNSYKNKLRYILDTFFTEGHLIPIIDNYYYKLKPYYQYDPYLSQMDINEEIIYLKNFINNRRNELLNLL